MRNSSHEPAHAAAIEDMGKAAFDHFPAHAHGLALDVGFQPGSVGIDGLPGRLVLMPPQIAVERNSLAPVDSMRIRNACSKPLSGLDLNRRALRSAAAGGSGPL